MVAMLITGMTDAFTMPQFFEKIVAKHNLSPHKSHENGLHCDCVMPFFVYISHEYCIAHHVDINTSLLPSHNNNTMQQN